MPENDPQWKRAWIPGRPDPIWVRADLPPDILAAQLRAAAQERPAEIRAEPRSVGQFGRNFLKSGGQQISNLAGAVMHPRQTISGLGTAARGVTQAVKGGPSPGQPDYRPILGAIAQGAKERYGNLERAGNTLYEDPVGAAMDASILAGGAGAIGRGLGMGARAAGLPRVAAGVNRVAGAANTASRAIDPFLRTERALTWAPRKIAAMSGMRAPTANRWMRSALKPMAPTSLRNKEQFMSDLSEIAIKHQVPVSVEGLYKWHDDFARLAEDEQRLMETLVAPRGRVVDPEAALASLDGMAKYYEGLEPAFIKELKRQIADFKKDILEEFPSAPGRSNTGMTGKQAMKAKQANYRRVRQLGRGTEKDWGKSYASLELQFRRAYAHGLMKEMERAFPELKPVLKDQSEYLKLEPFLEAALARIGKRDIVGIGTNIGVSAGHALTGSPIGAASVGAMKHLLDRPEFKSRLAIAIRKGRKMAGGVPYKAWPYARRGLGAAVNPRNMTVGARLNAFHRFIDTAYQDILTNGQQSGLGTGVQEGAPDKYR